MSDELKTTCKFARCFKLIAPPPNITGELHIGHVLNLVLQRIISTEWDHRGVRLQRTLGLDHAGLAVKYVLDRRGGGTAKLFWAWKRRIGNRVLSEIKRTLAERALVKVRFTLDRPFSMAVAYAFVKLYRARLVENKPRLLWWDGALDATVSRLEMGAGVCLQWVLMQRFVFESGEMIIWDSRCAVWLKTNYVSAVYISAHIGALLIELADLSLCKLKSASLINTANGNKLKLIINAGIADTSKCVHVNMLTWTHLPVSAIRRVSTYLGVLLSIKNLTCVNTLMYINTHYSSRTGARVVRKLTHQWFVNLRLLLKYCDTERVRFYPQRWKRVFNTWALNLSSWCVSRKMSWGHNLPVWKLDNRRAVSDTKLKAFYYLVLDAALPLACAAGAPNFLRLDGLVFDTWFSSALWCLSCLGWPNKTSELRRAHAGAVLTGYDIIFFWVLKMLLMSCFLVRGWLPFTSVVIHPIVCDVDGRKMSKTKNNVISPRALFNVFGLAAVRLYFSSVNLDVQQFRLCLNVLLSCRNAVTKLWHSRRARKHYLPQIMFTCSSWMCKWAITSVFIRLKRVTLSLRTFSTNLYLDTLLSLIRFDLNNLIVGGSARCACVSVLHDVICWRYRAVLPCVAAGVCLNTCYGNAFVATLITLYLTAATKNSALICSNNKRLFVQAPLFTLAQTNVYYLNKLRLSSQWQLLLLANNLFAWR
ncbi:MAG: class I tRNA ligase family protein [Candidatus Hodgkinia cicadicola]